MNNKLGCLSPLALGTAVITLLVIVISYLINGFTMFSPGELNADPGIELGGINSHAEIGNQCNFCHIPFWTSKTMSENCVLCHQNIQTEISDPKSLHGLLQTEGFIQCQFCHSEHQGEKSQLTKIDQNNFPHQATGFYLIAHKNKTDDKLFICSDCHNEENFKFDLNICKECHLKIDTVFTINHIETFGDQCLNCHDGVDRFSNFDHNLGQFRLENGHAEIACIKCHKQQKTVIEIQNTSILCVDCHAQDDPHDKNFGVNCEKCHRTTSWQDADFDHNNTGFILVGAHLEVECQACHTEGYENTSAACISCHLKDDSHSGKFGPDCAACHFADSWQNVQFDHNQTRFILDGAHLNIDCQDCHENNIYSGTPLTCDGCHQDPLFHLGLFPNQTCDSCHITISWKPAEYNEPHNFPYNHGEKNNLCIDCHQPNLTVWTCYSCHNQNDMINEHQDEGISDINNCLSCHPTGQESESEGTENNNNHDNQGEDD